MSAILPSSSSSLMRRRKTEFTYEIFLSFYGKDTRNGFTGHLYNALKRRGIKTFKDDKSLERGEYFAPELLRAIGESWGSIVVISNKYAFSYCCLDELIEIMKQKEDRGHKVYPIFYDIEPSDIRHQINSVKEAFDKHEKRHNKESTQGWRVALRKVADINGWALKDLCEADFIEDIVNDVSKKIVSEILDEKEVETMKATFQMIQAWLVDAENKQYMKERVALKVWLDKLKHIAYDMDDVLDEWNTIILKSKIEKDLGKTTSTPSTSSISQSEVHNIPLKIKELNEKYQAIVRERDDFSIAFSLNDSRTDLTLDRSKTTSLIDESIVFGRDQDKNKLIRLLLSDNNNEGGSSKGIPIIALVGMGGLGKTTLAQLAYNNDEVEGHFSHRIWVCVSHPFDEIRITKAILEALKGKPSKFNELQSLLQEICIIIKGKKFLLVLDDVWTEDEEKWKPLKLSLGVGSQKSKILVTTRNVNVARILGCPRAFLLGVLSNEDSWSLFSKIALFERSDQDQKRLESIGRKLVRKCAGLPLAIKTLASLLRLKGTEDQWQRILVSEMWKLEEKVFENLYAPLMLSYYDLPMSLKQCFRYCAIFPKDHRIKRDALIKYWMAQGFLGETSEGNDLEIIGEECFINLAIRGFFQQFKMDGTDGSIIECKMHDIVHDFAQFLTRTECVLVESDGIEVQKRVESFQENARHLTLTITPTYNFPILDPLKKLRSFLVLSSHRTSEPTPPKIFHQLIKLRMLSFEKTEHLHLEGQHSLEIPKEIGKLIHLRYLNLEGNGGLYELPEALCEICNLQTLNIRWCRNLQKLPSGMEKLINLRHLQNKGTDSITYLPKGMQKLTYLQTLEWFVIAEQGGGGSDETSCSLADLGKLIHLRGHLEIIGLQNVGKVSEAREALLSIKAGLRSLVLYFSGGHNKKRQTRIEDEASLLEALQPPLNLSILQIWSCEGPSFPFPNWMHSLTSLKCVDLYGCYYWGSLPPLGKLPSLESLFIKSLKKVKKVGREFLGFETSSSSSFVNDHNISFPNLEVLEFKLMGNWEEWEYERSSGDDSSSNIPVIMPKLEFLNINECPKLKTLPLHLLQSRALQQLYISRSHILYGRFNKKRGDDWPSISHIPTVYITF